MQKVEKKTQFTLLLHGTVVTRKLRSVIHYTNMTKFHARTKYALAVVIGCLKLWKQNDDITRHDYAAVIKYLIALYYEQNDRVIKLQLSISYPQCWVKIFQDKQIKMIKLDGPIDVNNGNHDHIVEIDELPKYKERYFRGLFVFQEIVLLSYSWKIEMEFVKKLLINTQYKIWIFFLFCVSWF